MGSAAISSRRRSQAIAVACPAEDERPDSDDVVEPGDGSDLDYEDIPCTDDDSRWDAFIPDDDEFDPLPDPGDFWIENSQ